MHTHQVSALGAQLVLEPLKGPNPFVNTSTILSPFEKVRLWCFGILLVPIRCLVVAGAFLACACASYVATMGEKQEDLQRQSEHPRPRWRQAAASAVPVCARMYVGARACLDLVPPFPPRAIWFLGLPVCRRMVWGLGFVSIRTKGRPVSAREAPVIVANHMGMIEAAYLVHVYGASVVTTVENAKVPLLGAIVRAMRCVTVDRAAGSGMDAIKARILTPGTQTLIFPEGTTTNQSAVLAFKRGAFVAGQTVQPVACRITAGSGLDTAWVNDGPGQLSLFLRLMAEPVNKLEVQFLPVHCPSAQEVADPDLFAAGVQKDIADALGVPCSQYTFEDSWVGGLVLKHGLDPTSCMVQWKTLQRAVSISRDDMKDIVEAFAAADEDRNGTLRWAEFRDSTFPAADADTKRDWFEKLQVQGAVDLRHFCIGWVMAR